MRARLDTGLTETFAEIDGVYMQNQIDLAIVNDTMYIIGSKEIYQDELDSDKFELNIPSSSKGVNND